jgi:outer membrane protein OmpA-like peptidoglycan-associated protein
MMEKPVLPFISQLNARRMKMLIRKNPVIVVVLIPVVCFLAACAGPKLKVKPIPLSENPTEQINLLENDISKAHKNQLNVLSPTWFAKAETSLDDAKKGLNRGERVQDILQKVAEGRAQLQLANEMAEVAQTTLPKTIKARDLARAAGATKLGEDYAEVEAQFLDLTKAIENDNLLYAQTNRVKVTEAFDQLELRAIKEQTIGEVRRLINQAEKEEAKEIVPLMLALAKMKLRVADTFITKHRYQKEEMQKKASEALSQARRLSQVTRQSERLNKMEPEQITLWVEGILFKVTGELGAQDMRYEAIDTQVENIVASITALQEDRKFLAAKVKAQDAEIKSMTNQIASLEGQTQEEQAAKQRLAAEKRFNQLFSEVRSYFEPKEAEVYKQGTKLVVRLKAMQFPLGKHTIMPDKYPLLSKVQRAIRTFDQSSVIIEGHTDSTGSDEVNEHLSQQRAEAVRGYLVANKTLPSERIIAVGYGSKRPLASNETAEGRAINRRIDVIITPLP